MAVIIKGAQVLDVANGTWSVRDVATQDNRFTDASRVDRSAETIDGTDKYVIPGLIDCHVHVTAFSADFRQLDQNPASYVYAQTSQIMSEMLTRGFTTVRDMGGADFGLARAQSEGLVRGPRLFFCGHAISQTGGHADMRLAAEDFDPCTHNICGVGVVADGVDAVRAAARQEVRKGANHLKIMGSGGVASPTDRIDSTQYAIDEIDAIVEEAKAANIYAAAHVYTARAINRVLRAGVRSIEHGNILDDETLELLTKYDAYLVPTLVTYWALKEEGRENGLSQSSWEKVDTVLATGLEAIRRASEANTNVVYGTDLLGEMHRHQNEEFRLLKDVQSPLQAIRSATSTAAALLEREGELGVIADGALADALVLDANPLDDICVLADIADHLDAVIQSGEVVSSRPS